MPTEVRRDQGGLQQRNDVLLQPRGHDGAAQHDRQDSIPATSAQEPAGPVREHDDGKPHQGVRHVQGLVLAAQGLVRRSCHSWWPEFQVRNTRTSNETGLGNF